MDNFKRLKRKYIIEAIVKSAVIGLGVALLAVGASLLSVKLSANKIAWFFYLLIGVVSFGVAFAVTYLIIRPFDKRVAKRLDNDYDLHEKVQTMIEFDGEDSEMLVLQRKDTEKHLEDLPKKKFTSNSLKSIWQYIVVAVLGVSIFIAGAVVPSKYVPPYDDNFNLSEWDIIAFQQLIDNVKSSKLEDNVKIPMVENLELLFDELKETTSASTMRRKVRASAEAIDTAVILANTYREILLAMNDNTALNDFKSSILRTTTFYKSDIEVNSFDKVNSLYASLEDEIRATLMVFTDTLEAKIADISIPVEIKDKVDEFLTPLNDSMGSDEMQEKFGNSEDPDAIYTALSNMSSELGKVYQYAFIPHTELKNIVSNADADYLSDMTKALIPQVYNKIVNEYVFNTLSAMFNVNIYPEDLVLPGISDNPNGGDDSPSHGGSIGEEDVIYGGNDAIYDPESDEHVPYGKVWNSYMAKLYNRLNDPDNEMSDEMKNYIMQYIKALSGDSTDTGEE